MKKEWVVFISLFLFIFGGCYSGPSSKSTNKSIPPRRTFKSVENIDVSAKEPFNVQEFVNDGISYSKGSIRYSTALFLSDLGILEEMTKKQFDNYVSVFFSKLPKQDQINEIIIPNLSKSEKENTEKNAYFFITKQKDKDNKDYYLIESNIPIKSKYTKIYDGYEIRLETEFYKDIIPGSWTSIMFLRTSNNNLFYRGMAYPSKSPPLIVSDTIGRVVSDSRMDEIISGKSTITQAKNRLKEEVDKILGNADPNNVEQTRSLTFLKKYTYLSISAYSYIDSSFKEAKENFLASEKITIDIPNDKMGSQFNELMKVMNYLIYTIGE